MSAPAFQLTLLLSTGIGENSQEPENIFWGVSQMSKLF